VTPRLYLDEDVVPELSRLLRSHGHDAISVHEIDGLHLEDPEQLERATNDGRALLTYNYHDFLRINEEWFLAGRSHAGIVISYRQYSRREQGYVWSDGAKLRERAVWSTKRPSRQIYAKVMIVRILSATLAR
jgi:hypothetical protein